MLDVVAQLSAASVFAAAEPCGLGRRTAEKSRLAGEIDANVTAWQA